MRIPLDETKKTLLPPLMEAAGRMDALIALDHDSAR